MNTDRIERVLSVVDSFEEAEAQDKAYWLAQTPAARLRQVEVLRRTNYGHHRTAARLQRLLEVVESPRR